MAGGQIRNKNVVNHEMSALPQATVTFFLKKMAPDNQKDSSCLMIKKYSQKLQKWIESRV